MSLSTTCRFQSLVELQRLWNSKRPLHSPGAPGPPLPRNLEPIYILRLWITDAFYSNRIVSLRKGPQAMRRTAPTCPWYVRIFDSRGDSQTCLAWKRFTKIKKKKHRPTGQQPGTKSGRRDKPDVNRSLTERFVPPSVYIEICLFVFSESRSRQLLSMVSKARGTVVFCGEPTRRRPVLIRPAPPRPAPPPHRAPRRLDPPVVCPGLGLDKHMVHTIRYIRHDTWQM